MNKLLKNSILVWLSLTLAITFMSYLGGKDGGSSDYPVYLTRAQQENPSLLFWELFPVSAIISGIVTSVGTLIIYFINKSKEFE
ncbi:MAG: hypothetical protein KA215_04725 [Flavobacterium sp.]|nr:hypothetical protein [Bacteroidota bacterium]MBK8364976.1 hypothetical protein [Bacteroidota bacterium]MBK9414343.1 hypothetical protein [Bacteroidota bacterium]MBP6584954.1 hypothetical protein [Flavobacterium sp.]MBP9888593.1 hypothetical protein [Leptospiraceae bacterium]